ncbi:acetolactate synthase-1/2/3 large subunit [Faunimonas pinastri]|uniref:Acetolactate synthase-1/2/3 large subunit n=1 Tax=Faunimonas pinastri TaxID=1855383 RepID=A0A1H9K7Q4_9HYPH|nr:thiamine pyrophosphate-requiring protein [Faunimonas pinastri]SEQ95190.1 acetolactate synthase-1/2/3 large subunit [Faunimonas pinastri]
MYTASSAFLDALVEAGVSYIFANLGSDHPALVEAIAEARAHGRKIPDVITCPNEMAGLSAAQGYFQASGRAQAVVVHVECGTQALAGAVHNAAKGRAPVLIFAGASPFTQDGEMRGSRNEFIQWIQDVHDQRGLVRGYMKYDNEFRTGRNIKQVTHRALQFAYSDPKGPVYLMGAREVMEEEVSPTKLDMAEWQPLASAVLPPEGVEAIATALAGARRPLVVTSYVGRQPKAVRELVRLCERLGIGVLESVPNAMNFPHDNPLYQGNQWNHPRQNPVLAEADVILVLDSDVPWIPTVSRPREDARIFHIDIDALKHQMPLWYIGSERAYQVDATGALAQINAYLDGGPVDGGPVDGGAVDEAAADERRRHYAGLHAERADELGRLEAFPEGDMITPEYLVACMRKHADEDMLFLNESISNYHTVFNHLALSRPGAIFTSGGGSLGWNGGAAIGVKLAQPEKTVVSFTGDGSYMFSVPSSVHWMARQYETPFLQIVFNNRGWKSPKLSALAVHPDGYASRANSLDVAFDPPPAYADIAAASGGAHARLVRRPDEVEEALVEALRVVREEGRCAVLDVWIPHL